MLIITIVYLFLIAFFFIEIFSNSYSILNNFLDKSSGNGVLFNRIEKSAENKYLFIKILVSVLTVIPEILVLLVSYFSVAVNSSIIMLFAFISIIMTILLSRPLRKMGKYINDIRDKSVYYTEFTDNDHEQYVRSKKDMKIHYISLISSVLTIILVLAKVL